MDKGHSNISGQPPTSKKLLLPRMMRILSVSFERSRLVSQEANKPETLLEWPNVAMIFSLA